MVHCSYLGYLASMRMIGRLRARLDNRCRCLHLENRLEKLECTNESSPLGMDQSTRYSGSLQRDPLPNSQIWRKEPKPLRIDEIVTHSYRTLEERVLSCYLSLALAYEIFRGSRSAKSEPISDLVMG